MQVVIEQVCHDEIEVTEVIDQVIDEEMDQITGSFRQAACVVCGLYIKMPSSLDDKRNLTLWSKSQWANLRSGTRAVCKQCTPHVIHELQCGRCGLEQSQLDFSKTQRHRFHHGQTGRCKRCVATEMGLNDSQIESRASPAWNNYRLRGQMQRQEKHERTKQKREGKQHRVHAKRGRLTDTFCLAQLASGHAVSTDQLSGMRHTHPAGTRTEYKTHCSHAAKWHRVLIHQSSSARSDEMLQRWRLAEATLADEQPSPAAQLATGFPPETDFIALAGPTAETGVARLYEGRSRRPCTNTTLYGYCRMVASATSCTPRRSVLAPASTSAQPRGADMGIHV